MSLDIYHMSKFPLTSLSFYRVKKDFTSASSQDMFIKNTILQFQSRTTNTYDCIEICHFMVWNTGEKKVWHFQNMGEEEMKGWDAYFEWVPREDVIRLGQSK
jgi:hypothetical protein